MRLHGPGTVGAPGALQSCSGGNRGNPERRAPDISEVPGAWGRIEMAIGPWAERAPKTGLPSDCERDRNCQNDHQKSRLRTEKSSAL